ncbi:MULTISPECIES: GtrA family protein [Ottowia]|uniref:GtrA family protein n=1 Tax=Ottowia TaxID=219181 RepID=UPI002C911E66|nr:GtrA family protein [Ottowia sp.]HRN75305.1 GtrA family protein [Ottowia sp.]HRQ02503.1 GtrA family protein [Ottowia sp.]
MSPQSVLPRYLIAGALNTLLSYLLYLALLPAAGYRVSYVVSFLAGIAGSFVLLRFAVFKAPGRRLSGIYVTASHLIQLGLGLAIVEAWVSLLHGPPALAALVAIAICVPLMFLAQRWIFMSGRQRGKP